MSVFDFLIFSMKVAIFGIGVNGYRKRILGMNYQIRLDGCLQAMRWGIMKVNGQFAN